MDCVLDCGIIKLLKSMENKKNKNTLQNDHVFKNEEMLLDGVPFNIIFNVPCQLKASNQNHTLLINPCFTKSCLENAKKVNYLQGPPGPSVFATRKAGILGTIRAGSKYAVFTFTWWGEKCVFWFGIFCLGFNLAFFLLRFVFEQFWFLAAFSKKAVIKLQPFIVHTIFFV
jgi:hypothetical protein